MRSKFYKGPGGQLSRHRQALVERLEQRWPIPDEALHTTVSHTRSGVAQLHLGVANGGAQRNAQTYTGATTMA